MRTVKTYKLDGISGFVSKSVARSTGVTVSLFHGDQSGLETDPEIPWMTVCEQHASCMGHKALRDARAWMAHPQVWCEGCRVTDVKP